MIINNLRESRIAVLSRRSNMLATPPLMKAFSFFMGRIDKRSSATTDRVPGRRWGTSQGIVLPPLYTAQISSQRTFTLLARVPSAGKILDDDSKRNLPYTWYLFVAKIDYANYRQKRKMIDNLTVLSLRQTYCDFSPLRWHIQYSGIYKKYVFIF